MNEELKKWRMKKSRSQELKMNRRNEWRIEEAKNEELKKPRIEE